MHRIARLPAEERRDIFSEAAATLGIRPTIIEKDFWVCFVLKALFEKSRFGEFLVFKGGTSLSKAHGLIERFSEDIDLVLDWKLIGFGDGLEDPMQNFDSKSKQDKFNKAMNRRAAEFIAKTLAPELHALLREEGIGLSCAVDEDDPHVINVQYPAAFSEAYIRPEVLLEIGPLAAWVPSSRHTIRPYAHDALPDVFEEPACEVVTIAAERTFWEKATILHQEAHRSTVIPQRCSRHYYDLYSLSVSSLKKSALAQASLLEEVVAFKKRFYPSAWARYDLAVPGSFRLLPLTEKQTAALARDYQNMQVMLFGRPPDFISILDELRSLESEINSIGRKN